MTTTTAAHIYGAPAALRREGGFSIPILIVAGCVLFNFILCFLNTAGLRISEAHIVVSELILVVAAAACAFHRPDRARWFWLLLLMAQFVFLAMLSIFRDELMIKAFRDVMTMPVFIALGLAASGANATKPLLWLSALITAVALFETFLFSTFVEYFNIKDYYIAKGFDTSDFEYLGKDVFVSGVRPGERFFPFPFEIHRISSVFLEPVSLGFYAFISGLYFIAMRDSLPRTQVYLAILLTLTLIWLGDARMAFGSLLIVLLFRPIFARLDHRLSFFIFPAALAFGFFIVESGLFDLSGEGIGARTLWTLEYLRSTEEEQLFGLRPYAKDMVDSGFLYLLSQQGIWGLLLYWLPPILFMGGRLSRPARVYWFGASIFLASGLMISYAIFTIKTAALLWFCYGYIIARTAKEAQT